MAEADYNSDDGTEAVFDINNDHRVEVADRANSKHPVHSAIFQVTHLCETCKHKSWGTCFMVKELNNIPNTGDFYYFATAGHVIYCKGCKAHHSVQVSYGSSPKVSFMAADEYIKLSSPLGWLAVSNEFALNCGQEKDDNDRHPHDFGLIAMRKESLTPEQRSELDTLYPATMLQAPSAREEFVQRAFVCGYPVEVKTKNVNGIMHWVPEECSRGGQPVTETETKERKKKERSRASLYPMPQLHLRSSKKGDGEGKGSSDTSDKVVIQRLFRHYIDASGGQSGSPVYEVVDGPEYRVVGIHVGFWKIAGASVSSICNVAVRVSEVVDQMKQYIKDNQGKPITSESQTEGTESYQEKYDNTYLLSTGIEGMPPKRESGQAEQPADADPGSESDPWEDLEFLTTHRTWITSLPAASLQQGCIKAGLITKQAEIKKLMRITDDAEHNAYILTLVTPGGRQSYEIFLAMLQRMNPLYKRRVQTMRKILDRIVVQSQAP